MSTRTPGPLGIAVIGAGYWGPNLVRNFGGSPDWNLEVVCDLDLDRARRVAGPHVEVTDSVERVLDDPRIDAVGRLERRQKARERADEERFREKLDS